MNSGTPHKLLILIFISALGILNLVSARTISPDSLDINIENSQLYTSPTAPSSAGVLQSRQTYPEWKFEEGFEFYNFWTTNEEKMVRVALLGAIELMTTAMRVLSGESGENLPYGENDPSFKRYFNPGDLNTFGAVIQRLLAVLGAPGTSPIRQCIAASKLQLIYGDGPADNPDKPFAENCKGGGTFAYYNAYTDKNKVIRSYISFCPLFFQSYRLHMPSSTTPSVPYVDPSKFLTYVDNADRYALPEVESSPAILMHEMLHWYDTTHPVINKQIVDVKLKRQDDGSTVRAYRSFYASKVKDAAWQSNESPLQNADSYVYTVLEIFYRYKYGRQVWADSPDPKGVAASPNIPPAGILNPNPP